MAKLKLNRPPLYIPSSGSIVKVKFRMSSGFGKYVFMVEPSDSSDKSREQPVSHAPASFYDLSQVPRDSHTLLDS